MTTVMCFGTFDLLHLGHLHYFKQAKSHGDTLIVVVARDVTKKKQKKALVFDEQERVALVGALKVVDAACLGDEVDHFKIIEELRPDVICLGYDQQIKEDVLKKELTKRGVACKIVRASSYDIERHKSSKVKFRFLQEG